MQGTGRQRILKPFGFAHQPNFLPVLWSFQRWAVLERWAVCRASLSPLILDDWDLFISDFWKFTVTFYMEILENYFFTIEDREETSVKVCLLTPWPFKQRGVGAKEVMAPKMADSVVWSRLLFWVPTQSLCEPREDSWNLGILASLS